MPGINDDPAQVEKILELAAEAGAVSVTGIHLHLRGEVKDITMDWLASYRPDLVPRYERLYGRGAYAPTVERDRVSTLVKDTWERVAPNRETRARYVRTADDPAPHRVPEAAQEDLQGALF
jgi:DNA repair photolyase